MRTRRAVLVSLVAGCIFFGAGCGDEGGTGENDPGPTFTPPGASSGGPKGGGEEPAPNGGVVGSGASSSGSTTPTPPAGGADSTKGSGGPTGFSTQTSKGGLKYQIDAPAGAGKPLGLLVLLHGSTASNYTNFVPMMKAVATQYDLIRVSVLAPNGQGWNEGGNAAQASAADKLHALVQDDLFPKYDIDKKKIVFSGQSSGGGFLATHFVPLHAKDYVGGALMQCGAAPPASSFAPSTDTKKNFRLHFEITTGDPIWPQSYAQAVSAYTSAGMSLTKDNTKPGGHCAFDQQKVIQDHIKFILGL